MNRSGGFTLAEFLVAISLVVLVFASATSFFIYQSRYGAESSAKRRAREDIAGAFLLIRQDIMHAGYGLENRPELSIFLEPEADGKPRTSNPAGFSTSVVSYSKFYVNYGRYLETDINVSDKPSIFQAEAWFDGPEYAPSVTAFTVSNAGRDIVGEGAWSMTNVSLDKHIADHLILVSKSGSMRSLELAASITSGLFVTKGQSMSGTETEPVCLAPAISYKYERENTSKPFDSFTNQMVLKRNGRVLLGGDARFRINDFRVRAVFYDDLVVGENKDIVSPLKESGADANHFADLMKSLTIAKLRAILVAIDYQTYAATGQEGASQWSTGQTREIRVTPRGAVMKQFKDTLLTMGQADE